MIAIAERAADLIDRRMPPARRRTFIPEPSRLATSTSPAYSSLVKTWQAFSQSATPTDAGALATARALALARQAHLPRAPRQVRPLTAAQILFEPEAAPQVPGERPGAWRSESLTSPDDITELGQTCS